ncbi:hypothetical protein DFQ30_010437 [Apophysomyces sp. BC1015]|nr:hypothetical protein DFQ30_010437 [Apophysomyces sp. BC1015]
MQTKVENVDQLARVEFGPKTTARDKEWLKEICKKDPDKYAVRSRKRKNESEKKEAAARKRIAKLEEKRRVEQKKDKGQLCKTCEKEGDYDTMKSHSRVSSHLCPSHKKSKKEDAKEILGDNLESFTRKILLGSVCKSSIIVDNIVKLQEATREIVQEVQLFSSRVVLYLLNTQTPIPTVIFSQDFFYTCSQYILGRDVTGDISQTSLKPVMDTVFDGYKKLRPKNILTKGQTYQGDIMHTLAAACVELAVAASNYIVENFEGRVIWYIKRVLKKELNSSSNEVSNDTINKLSKFTYDIMGKGQPFYPYSVVFTSKIKNAIDCVTKKLNVCPDGEPVTDANLAARPHLYLPVLFEILQDIEKSNDTSVRFPSDTPSKNWTEYKCRTKLDSYEHLNDKEKRKLVGSLRGKICFISSMIPKIGNVKHAVVFTVIVSKAIEAFVPPAVKEIKTNTSFV